MMSLCMLRKKLGSNFTVDVLEEINQLDDFDNLQISFSTPVFPFFILACGVIKSIVMVFHLPFGGGEGCRNPNGL